MNKNGDTIGIMTAADIARAKGASDVFEFTYDHADVAQTFVFDRNDWGLSRGASVDVSDAVRPTNEFGGLWEASITLLHLDAYSSAHVSWEGSGFIAEYTVNGGANTMPIPESGVITLPPGADFDIRATWLDGTGELTKLTVQVLKTDTINSTGSRVGTFTGDAITDEGLILRNASLVIPASTLPDAPTVGTIEFWARADQSIDTDWVSFFEYLGWGVAGWVGYYNTPDFEDNHWQAQFAAVYVDGLAVPNNSTDFVLTDPLGWHHWVVVSDTAVNDAFGIGGTATHEATGDTSVRHLALYPQRMTAAEAQALYAAQNPTPIRIDDPGTITVTEHSPATDIYAYAWSVVTR